MDFIRGISALAVCAAHLRAAMFIDISQKSQSSSPEKAFYFITSLGHEAVMIFFVLSGFFVGGAVVKKKNSFAFDDYLTARLSRLWTPLIPALLLTLLLDGIVRAYNPQVLSGGYYNMLNSGPRGDYSISALTFIANLFFVQTIYSPVFGTNGPLWSLTYEFWYYMLFPLLMIVLGIVKKSIGWRIVAAGLLLPIGLFILPTILAGFFVWLFGVGVYCMYGRSALPQHFAIRIITFLGLAGFLVNAKLPFLGSFFKEYNDLFIGLTFSLFLLSIEKLKVRSVANKLFEKLSVGLSEISYTLYIVHFPIAILIFSFFYSNSQVSFSVQTLSLFLLWFALIVCVSVLCWYLFERNTPSVRKLMKGLINKLEQKKSVQNHTIRANSGEGVLEETTAV